MDTILLPPSASALMESTRSIGYSLESAIADIIDNSIAAKATNIDINFSPPCSSTPFIAVLDNGEGMAADELQSAMRYGCKNPLARRTEKDLGRYGLGLKTASLSQCQILTVVSKKNNSALSCCSWDLHYIRETDSWELLILNKEEMSTIPCLDLIEKYESGTLVIWQDLDRIFAVGDSQKDVLGAKMVKVREHLSLVFHRYISGEDNLQKVNIQINNSPLIPIDPFLRGRSTKPMEPESIKIHGSNVTVTSYVLPHTSRLSKTELDTLGGQEGLRKSQGFYIYRNKRLVVWGTWFRMRLKGDLSKLARIQVDIPNTLDDLWTLDIKKSVAIPPEEVQQNLRKIVERIANISKETWTYRGKKEQKNSENEIWSRVKTRSGGFQYQINSDHLLIRNLFEAYPNAKRSLGALFHLIESRLPLNSLYIDLVQDEKVTNNDEIPPAEILVELKNILSLHPNIACKKASLNLLLGIPPFDRYREYIQKNEKGILEDA